MRQKICYYNYMCNMIIFNKLSILKEKSWKDTSKYC